MILSDTSVRRPVFATVMILLLVTFGIVSYDKLPLREYPDIDPPVVSITTDYPGAAANVVETRITQLVEDRIAGVEGIRSVDSVSRDGRSQITVEFSIDRDIDGAANDIRDRVSRILDDIPDEADPPDIRKVDADENVIMWLNLVSDRMDNLELTDYARRYLQDRFATLEGVARVRVGGGLDYSMRIWIDRRAMAAHQLAVSDIEAALRAENVELPAGSVESVDRHFSVRVTRSFRSPQDFESMVIGRGGDGHLVRMRDVARVELGAEERRTFFRGNGVPMVGIGIIKQSTANTLDVTDAAKAEMRRVNQNLPAGMEIKQSYDTSIFIRGAIDEVYKTLLIAIGLVIFIIFLFLGSFRTMLIPAFTVPISLISTFIALWALGFTINLLTLLALVLAVGLVVDDTIVVTENIYRRIRLGEPPLSAAFLGARQVAFAVIATTLALIAVFVPIAFLEGDIGRLFSEFALTMASAVAFSSFVALSLTPVMCSTLLHEDSRTRFAKRIDRDFHTFNDAYKRILTRLLHKPAMAFILIALITVSIFQLGKQIPSEFAPQEDRGAFFIIVNGPEGASYSYIKDYMDIIEERLSPMVETGEVQRLLIRAPRSFGNPEVFSNGIGIINLNPDWGARRSAFVVMQEVRQKLSDLAGVRAFPVMRQGFGQRLRKPVQVVLGGSTYEELAEWRDIIMEKARQNPGLVGLDYDYKETKPQLRIMIDRQTAGDMGVSVSNISKTLESMLGSRRVTTYQMAGEEYDVMIEEEPDSKRTPNDITNLYVRSESSGLLVPLANLIKIEEYADAGNLNRYNRMRSITFEANLADGYALGEAISFFQEIVNSDLPASARLDFKGDSLEYVESSEALYFTFILSLVVIFLVLAAQFESFIHPFVIMMTVPLAVSGALLGLYLTGQSLNIYSQIGIIMLVGLAAKNGILIVEFINQLRDQGKAFEEAIIEASAVRLRPIIMTAITTVAGAIPLILSFGAGAETRYVIGIVVFAGVAIATFFTLFIIPVMYKVLAKGTRSPAEVGHRLDKELESNSHYSI